MLVSHIAQGHKIFIQIDSDADGYTSAALLINYLNNLFPGYVQNNISYSPHSGKQHGIDITALDINTIDLVIAPDSSSNEYELHQSLHQRGIDVLVIDHHEAERISEYACVINNQLCDYPTKSLSGVGMVYKFCCYLDSLLQVDYASQYLDLVALGLCADMMDLRDFETRHLITLGIKQIQNPYFKGMVAKNEYSLQQCAAADGNVTPFGISYYIAPYINAVCRSGTIEEKIMLFEAMLDFKAYELIPSTKRGGSGQFETRVEQACRNCSNIKNRQTKARDSSLEIIEHIIKSDDLLNNSIIVVTIEKEHAIERNVAGLIANMLQEQFQKPILILSETIHEDGSWWEGSGRNPEGSPIENLREYLENTGLIEYAEGHASAFGFGIKDQNIDKFIEITNKELQAFDFTHKYLVDFEYNSYDNNAPYDILNLGDYKHLWGKGVKEPLIAVKNLKITKENIHLLKRNTLRIDIPSMGNVSLIKFGSSEEEYNSLCSDLGCVTINVIGTCERNSYFNTPQIKMKDYEIAGRTEYYF